MKWIASITAILGTLGLGALFLVPGMAGILTAATAALGPLLKGFSELLVWFIKTVWEGFVDIIDNVATIVTVISLVAGFSLYYKYYGPERTACEQEIVKLVEQNKQLKAKLSRGR